MMDQIQDAIVEYLKTQTKPVTISTMIRALRAERDGWKSVGDFDIRSMVLRLLMNDRIRSTFKGHIFS